MFNTGSDFQGLFSGARGVDVLKGKFEVAHVCRNVIGVCEELLNEIGGCWTNDITQLTEVIASWCPDWKSAGADLMNNAPMIKELFHNANYARIVPACTKLEEMRKLAKAFQHDGTGITPPVPDAALKQAGTEVKNGVSTVAVTYGCFLSLEELPKVINNVARAKQVDAFLSADASKGVAFPKSLIDLFDKLRSPRVEPQLGAAPAASAASAAAA